MRQRLVPAADTPADPDLPPNREQVVQLLNQIPDDLLLKTDDDVPPESVPTLKSALKEMFELYANDRDTEKRVYEAVYRDLKNEQARLTEKAEADSLDAITNLPLRKACYETLEKKHLWPKPGGHIIGIIEADLRGFKPVNDIVGKEPMGNEVIRQEGRIIKSCARSESLDAVFRVGGDEIVTILSARPSDTEDASRQLKASLSVAARSCLKFSQHRWEQYPAWRKAVEEDVHRKPGKRLADHPRPELDTGVLVVKVDEDYKFNPDHPAEIVGMADAIMLESKNHFKDTGERLIRYNVALLGKDGLEVIAEGWHPLQPTAP